MKRVIDILNKTQFGALATIEKDKPRVRPFQFQFAVNNRLYFCSSATKNVVKQIIDNPFIEYTAFDKALNYIRISGKVNFSNDTLIRVKVFRCNPYYKEKFIKPENTDLVIFFIEHGEAMLGNFDSYPPEIVKF